MIDSNQGTDLEGYVAYLLAQGLLPEALHAAPNVAERLYPNLAATCAEAQRPIDHVETRYGSECRRFAVQAWEFSAERYPWVVGNDAVGIYGCGRDLERAAEHFSERLHRVEDAITPGEDHPCSPPELRRIVDWIRSQVKCEPVSNQSSATTAWDGYRLYQKTRYGEAKAALDGAYATFYRHDRTARSNLRRFSAFISVRCGEMVAGAYGQEHLKELLRYDPVTDMTCSDFMCCTRYAGLCPSPQGDSWFNRGVELSRSAGCGAKALLYLYGGMTALARGTTADARALLEKALEIEVDGMAELRVAGLILAGLAEVDRIQGEYDRARETLGQVRQGQESEELWGDLGDFTLTGLAKLECDANVARELLDLATAHGLRTGNLKCQLRALLIEARICHNHSRARELKAQAEVLVERIIDAKQCPLTQRILQEWNRWTSGVASPETDYWGL